MEPEKTHEISNGTRVEGPGGHVSSLNTLNECDVIPDAVVDIIPVNLNWQRSARTHVTDVERIANCDLIIDATGDVPTALMLGAIAAENDKPFVSAEVFEGGLGCLVARAIPGRDPAYVAGRTSYYAYCDHQNVPPPPASRRAYTRTAEIE